MVLVPGARLGPYAIVDLIGAGGMGEVYRARDTRLDRTVALKILPPKLSNDPARRARFAREAKAISQLSHPHICALYDIGDADLPSTEYRVPNPKSPVPSPVSVSYLVMEHLEGETLAARLDRGALPLDQALRVGAEMADALAYAHRHGIVHRDLKPGNIMLTASDVKLLDFGLAKLKAGSGLWAFGSGDHARPTATTESLTTEGKVLGTVPYMAPEQVEGKETDARTDIFALGCVLYEMVTARRAFDGPSSAAILSAILRDDPPPVVDHQRLTPPQLDHLVRTCLAKDPGERWRSASDVARELQWIGAPTAAVRPQRLSRRSAMVAGVTALVLLAAGVLLGRWPRRGPPATTSASVAVVYFENLSDSRDQDSLGRMLTGLLITELSRSPRLEVVSSQRLFDIARRLGREDVPVDRSVATEIATRAGAASMLVGQVARTREGLVATTELVDVKSGQLLGSYRATGRTENDMFSMAETLGQEVRRGLDAGEAPAATSSGLARTQTQRSRRGAHDAERL